VAGRTASLALIPLGIAQNRLEFLPKQLPVNYLAQFIYALHSLSNACSWDNT